MNINDYKGITYLHSATDRPTFSYTAASEAGKPGAYALVTFGAQAYTINLDPDTGFFSWTAPDAVKDGHYSFSVVIVDRAGNHSQPGLATFIVDTTPPTAPEILSIYDDAGKESYFQAGGTSDDTTPTLTGIAQRGSTVFLKNAQGETIGSAVADAESGKWVITPTVELEEGANNLELVAVENFAKADRVGTPFNFVINVAADASILPPDTITITQAFDDAGSATGPLSNGALTDDTTPTLSGIVSANSIVTVYYRLAGSSMWAGSATANVTGESWSWTPGSALPTGMYEFQAAIADKSSALFTLDIATAADIISRTRIDSVEDDFGTATGLLANGAITDDATPTFLGSAEANSKVVIRYTLVGNVAASVVVDADSAGKWSWTPGSDLPGGTWGFAVKAQGQNDWTGDFILNIKDAAAGGFAPVIDYAADNVGSKTDNLMTGDATDDNTPELYGRAEANSVVSLRYRLAAGSWIETTVKADMAGNWNWTPEALELGDWTFEVQKPGQGSWDSFTLSIESEAPPAVQPTTPTITLVWDNVGIIGSVSRGQLTDDSTPSLSGNATKDTQVAIQYRSAGGTWLDADIVDVNSSGTWNYTSLRLPRAGEWEYRVKGVNQDKESNWSSSYNIVYDPNYSESIRTHNTFDYSPQFTGSVPNGGIYQGIRYTTNAAGGVDTVTAHGWSLLRSGQFIKYEFSELASKFHYYFRYDNITYGSNGTGRIDFLNSSNQVIGTISNGYGTGNPSEEGNFFAPTGSSGIAAVVITATSGILTIGRQNYTTTGYKNPNASWFWDKQPTAEILNDDTQGIEQYLADTNILAKQKGMLEINSEEKLLKINLQDILDNGEEALFIQDGTTQLLINGNEGDVVQLADILPEGSDISEWQHLDGTVTVAGVEYQVYSHGDDAELLVQQGVKTELV